MAKHETDDFERMLSDQRDHYMHYKNHQIKEIHNSTTKSTADANCSCYDFIKMVQSVTRKALKKYNIDFSSDRLKYNVTDPQIHLDNPVITYKTVSRVPYKELKPRIRDTVSDMDSNMIGNIYAQKFESVIQFNIFASVYDLAEEVMDKFEEMMIKYAGFFKQRGVSELVFSEELSDSEYDMFRQIVSVRSIRYKVYTERIYNNLDEVIDDVIVQDVSPEYHSDPHKIEI